MDDGRNLFVFSGVNRHSTSQHFDLSGNLVDVRYHSQMSCAFVSRLQELSVRQKQRHRESV